MTAELTASLARSEHDTSIAKLFAESAAAANGSMGFEEAASFCLAMICDARRWSAAHVWRVDDDGRMLSTSITHVAPAAPPVLTLRPPDACPADHLAHRALDARCPLVDAHADAAWYGLGECADKVNVLAWPVEIDGHVELVLEFFSLHRIVVDDEVRGILRHVAVQLAHVRQRERAHDRTQLMAFTDTVTGLPNRTGFEHLFAQKLKEARRAHQRLALMFVDLDGFKRVNDSLGHATGDRLLQTVGKRLEEHVRGADLAAKLDPASDTIAARLGGDEFTLVVTDVPDSAVVAAVAQRFLDVLSRPIDVGFQDVSIGASIGIAVFPDDGKSMSELMRLADAAMYEAKAIPGNHFRFATPALNEAIQRRLWLEGELQQAIRQDDLDIAYAPIVAAMTRRIVGNEVVLRWPHRDGEIPFDEFFAIAENSGLINELSAWVIDKVCAAAADRRWREHEHPRVALDISLLQLQQPQFVTTVRDLLYRYDCRGSVLEFEFSDTAAILRNEACRKNLHALHELGVRIVLDRFGTGYTSLQDIAELPVWRIKLNRRFVEAVGTEQGHRSMSRAIIAMAHSLGIETTIYGVTSEAQAKRLQALGADALQGRFLGEVSPVPAVAPQDPGAARTQAPVITDIGVPG